MKGVAVAAIALQVTDFATTGKPFKQISDHYACMTSFEIATDSKAGGAEAYDALSEFGDMNEIRRLQRFHPWRYKPCFIIALIILLGVLLLLGIVQTASPFVSIP